MRVDQLMNLIGCGSRKGVKRLLKRGQVNVDGRVVKHGNVSVDPGLQTIMIAGQRITSPIEHYWILNKPQGVVTAVSDEQHCTVVDCLRGDHQVSGVYPVGRLDRDTEGLVLLTTNGPLGFRLLHPKYHVNKTYYVEVNGGLNEADVVAFNQGIVFHDGTRCQPAILELLTSSSSRSSARVTIKEGKFHQIKKMFLSRGVKVMYLKRESFGDLMLEDALLPGQYRTLHEEELNFIRYNLV